MALPLGSTVEVTLRGVMFGQTILHVFHYQVTTASAILTVEAESLQIADDISQVGPGSFLANLRLIVPVALVYQESRAQGIDPIRYAAQSFTLSLPGQGSSFAQSANSAAVLTKRTALAGRRYIGSLHLPMDPNNDGVAGVISDPFRVLLLDFAANMLAPLTATVGGGVYSPVIYHRPPLLDAPTPIVSIIPQSTTRVMRRRTVGVGI
jgi:hypothetical protein